MKMWDQLEFAHGSQTDFREETNIVKPVGAINGHYAWIKSLPIAAAVVQQSSDIASLISTNHLFDALIARMEHERGLDLENLASRISKMNREKRESHFERWQSLDSISRLELEINIARYGDGQDMYLLTMVDRTAEVISRINLRREMLNDSLTGFFNRSGFEEEIELTIKNLSKRDGQSSARYAVLLIDLARFSRINESVGAMAGDELIITVARRLNSRIRSNEILCRLGGNEFALFVLLDDEASNVENIAARLNDAFAQPCQLSNLEIQVECAFAAAIGNSETDDPMDTLRFAQIALKRAKRSKRFELYAPGAVDNAQRRFSLETDLRRAIQRGELELHYQPLMDLETGAINGFEALARWEHPDLGFISPVDFIPVAEESGLIVPLGRWALQEAARTIADWDSRAEHELPFKISVNMSAVQMLRDDVTEAVSQAIHGAGITGDRLTIELTESAFVDDPDGAKRILESLKALDTNLAMDDFGTGYSNLAYLQKLPIDVLKIDRSFIAEMLTDRDKQAIVSTVLSLASALGMKTTAEGIESEAISDVLKSLGCSVGQGYYYAKPLTNDAAYSFLEASRAASTR
ncbi:putative bifunctional diguanylate cyclase/phosphodiesterase [Sphingorhabdus arenilitoris]|uniref:Bifunctional diguanylate cyclase/phosphodiesterase n=1 Tax=Sphingorhabdus arenilitoris TaxID=1490041 RepID=A0ABV8RGC6_9SPHN